MVILHDKYMREFLVTWRKAKQLQINLPVTDDPDYQSLDHLLSHLLRAARGYMTWMCKKLGLPDPGIDNFPPPETAERDAEAFLQHVLEKWREPLANVAAEAFENISYKSRWGMDYSIDSMLEHAVMHPIRHIFQLEELMEAQE
jgi:uncharacterized damage-inducible protein DinB